MVRTHRPGPGPRTFRHGGQRRPLGLQGWLPRGDGRHRRGDGRRVGTGRLWIAKVPARAINLPGRKRHEYWTGPANRAALDHTVATALEIFGVATLGLLTSIVLISGAVANGVDVPGVVFGAQFVFFAVVFVWGIAYLIGKTRLPK